MRRGGARKGVTDSMNSNEDVYTMFVIIGS